MERGENFSACLKRCLAEAGMSASEAARTVGFRSRNSIFRILQGDTSSDVNERFLEALRSALEYEWPKERWVSLREALAYDRLGPEQYRSKRAFRHMMFDTETNHPDVTVETVTFDGQVSHQSLAELLDEMMGYARVELVMTGCCEAPLARLLADKLDGAGLAGRLTMRHYIDTTEEAVVGNILGILPLVNKPWYNARLVSPGSCPAQIHQVYRLHALHVSCWDAQGRACACQMTAIDASHFVRRTWNCPSPGMQVLDRFRFDLELLKPTVELGGTAQDFINYTTQYAKLEEKCTILSVKPDVHFNCIPPAVLESSIREGFALSGLAAGEALEGLIQELWQIHERRFSNMMEKHKPTHLIYSYPAMERFMRTGVLSDHFYLQRAYTLAERREIIRTLRDAMIERPWFQVHFLRSGTEPTHEISYYGNKGVMIMSACTGYDLVADHSEALVTLPVFTRGFRDFFMDCLLKEEVFSRGETMAMLDRLLNMDAG